MLVMSAVAVGLRLPKVLVSTSDKLEVAMVSDDVRNGIVDGSPDVSSDVCTEPVVLVGTGAVAVWISDVDNDVSELSGTLTVATCVTVVGVETVVNSVVVPPVDSIVVVVLEDPALAALDAPLYGDRQRIASERSC